MPCYNGILCHAMTVFHEIKFLKSIGDVVLCHYFMTLVNDNTIYRLGEGVYMADISG